MNNNLEKFNFLWKTNISQAEYNDILDKHPDLWSSYLLQEEIAKNIMSKVYFIIGVMCSGKTTISHKIGKLLDREPFHLDHINQSKPLVEAYKEALETRLIEGYTPFRNQAHYNAIMKALEGKEVKYIMVYPQYEQWLENCKPIIACPTDENPPEYTKEQYEAENERLIKLTNPALIIKSVV